MDVPENVAVAMSLVWEADRTLDPGAQTSVHVPQFENDDLLSLLVVKTTVIAGGT